MLRFVPTVRFQAPQRACLAFLSVKSFAIALFLAQMQKDAKKMQKVSSRLSPLNISPLLTS